MATALVTGGNRGLGLEVVRQLAEGGWRVLLGARNLELGERARESLGSPNVQAVALDVEDDASVGALAGELRGREPLDALINNAGASFDGFDAEVARRTLEVNYRGAVRVTDTLMPLLTENASIVMVSSGMGELSQVSTELRGRLLSERLQRADLDRLAEAFIRRAGAPGQRGVEAADGLPNNAYSVSKILLNGFTRVLAKELAASGSGTGRRVNAVCPGWVRTRMGGPAAPRSVERGARGIVWVAELGRHGSGRDVKPNGAFFRDEKRIEW